MSEDLVPSSSVDSHTRPMDVKLAVGDSPVNSEHLINNDYRLQSDAATPLLPSTTGEKPTANGNHSAHRHSPADNKQLKPFERFFFVPQIKTIDFYQALLSEYLGTMLLTLIATSSGLPIASKPIPDLNGALVSGFIVATIIVGFGHVSGAHINPAVTLTFIVVGEIDLLRGFCYVGMQLLGAVTASGIVQFIAPVSAHNNLGMTMVTEGVSITQALIVEVLITFILCYTVHAVCDKRRDDIGGSKALVVGLTVIIGCIFGGPYTGASMNPARSFGPASVMNSWENHWIYWVGPLTGSVLAALIYTYVLKPKSTVVHSQDPHNHL